MPKRKQQECSAEVIHRQLGHRIDVLEAERDMWKAVAVAFLTSQEHATIGKIRAELKSIVNQANAPKGLAHKEEQ